MKSSLYNHALQLLSRRAHGTEELKRKILRRGTLEQTERVIEKLTEKGYLNDKDFALQRALSLRRQKRWGDSRIAANLNSLGVNARIVELALQTVEKEYPEIVALKRVRDSWINSKGPPKTVSQLKKLFDKCRRLGHSSGKTSEVLKEFFARVNWTL